MQFYKPWEMLPGDKTKIESQIKEAEDTIERERTQFDSKTPLEETAAPSDPSPVVPEPEKPVSEPKEDMVGSETNPSEEVKKSPTNDDANVETNQIATPDPPEEEVTNSQEGSKEHEDDGGEMVEADEDMVIYWANLAIAISPIHLL